MTARPVSDIPGETIARQMLTRALSNATRPDVQMIAEVCALTVPDVTRVLEQVRAARRPVVTKDVRRAVLLAAADRLTHEANVLRRLAHDLPPEPPPGSGPQCPVCGRSFASMQGLRVHQTRTHKKEASTTT